jgi:DNA-binding NarL/FixJ family response regulator
MSARAGRKTPGPARILIVDDHPIVRQGLSQFIAQTEDLRVCGEAGDAREALEAIRKTLPDLVIVDLSLGSASGLDLVEELKAQAPKLPILVLSMHDETLYAERALRAGARGYVMKDRPIDEVVTAARRILRGEVHLSERMSARLLQKLVSGAPQATDSLIGTLSNRELQVFELIGQGFGTRNIAARLHLSVKTIDTHRENIKHKLSFADSVELHQHAFLWVQRMPKPGVR